MISTLWRSSRTTIAASAWCIGLPFERYCSFFRSLMIAWPFFRNQERAFRAAAAAKIARREIARGVNFHLTSRDVIEQMGN
jgi:hypothetical protein